MKSMKRLRGLRVLVEEMVEHGSKSVEDVHKATAARTFDVLEAIAPIATPARIAHAVHDLSVGSVYSVIRAVNKVVGRTLEVAIDVAEAGAPEPGEPGEPLEAGETSAPDMPDVPR